MNQPLIKPRRINVLDALRGFALFGILLIHMNGHFLFPSAFTEKTASFFPQIDVTVNEIIHNFAMGKFINIFALLFGISAFLQLRSFCKANNIRVYCLYGAVPYSLALAF